MPRNINIFDDEDSYEVIELGGVESPGRVTLSGHNRKINWDVKAGNGQKGATTTLKDIPPIEFTASFYLVRDDAQGINDDLDWPAFAAIVRSTISGPKPKALDIWHPDLAENDIKSVVLAEFGAPVYDGKGGRTIAIKFQEYALPKPAGGSPYGSKPNATSKPTDPDAEAKAQLAALAAQYKATPWG